MIREWAESVQKINYTSILIVSLMYGVSLSHLTDKLTLFEDISLNWYLSWIKTSLFIRLFIANSHDFYQGRSLPRIILISGLVFINRDKNVEFLFLENQDILLSFTIIVLSNQFLLMSDFGVDFFLLYSDRFFVYNPIIVFHLFKPIE